MPAPIEIYLNFLVLNNNNNKNQVLGEVRI